MSLPRKTVNSYRREWVRDTARIFSLSSDSYEFSPYHEKSENIRLWNEFVNSHLVGRRASGQPINTHLKTTRMSKFKPSHWIQFQFMFTNVLDAYRTTKTYASEHFHQLNYRPSACKNHRPLTIRPPSTEFWNNGRSSSPVLRQDNRPKSSSRYYGHYR